MTNGGYINGVTPIHTVILTVTINGAGRASEREDYSHDMSICCLNNVIINNAHLTIQNSFLYPMNTRDKNIKGDTMNSFPK